jgi:hypothetical protein
MGFQFLFARLQGLLLPDECGPGLSLKVAACMHDWSNASGFRSTFHDVQQGWARSCGCVADVAFCNFLWWMGLPFLPWHCAPAGVCESEFTMRSIWRIARPELVLVNINLL